MQPGSPSPPQESRVVAGVKVRNRTSMFRFSLPRQTRPMSVISLLSLSTLILASANPLYAAPKVFTAAKAIAVKKAARSAVTAKSAVVAKKAVVKIASAAATLKTAAKAAPVAHPSASWWEASAVEVVAAGRGRINYEAGVVKAVGLGALAPPTLSRSRSQDALDARSAALADALKTLAMTVGKVRVNATTRVENYILKREEVRIKIAAVIQSAEVVEEKLLPTSGVYRVVVTVPLSGAGSLSEAINLGDEDKEDEEKKVVKKEPEPQPDPYAPGAPPPPGATYTGLIIDCRGLDVNACMSPRLFEPNGAEVYGTMKISPDYVIEVGIASFPHSMKEAQRAGSRVGDRPLIVRARSVADRNRFYPVISDSDARRIRDANAADRFLERTAVAFLLDPM